MSTISLQEAIKALTSINLDDARKQLNDKIQESEDSQRKFKDEIRALREAIALAERFQCGSNPKSEELPTEEIENNPRRKPGRPRIHPEIPAEKPRTGKVESPFAHLVKNNVSTEVSLSTLPLETVSTSTLSVGDKAVLYLDAAGPSTAMSVASGIQIPNPSSIYKILERDDRIERVAGSNKFQLKRSN